MIDIKYFNPIVDSENDYIRLLESYYGSKAFQRYKKRGDWYNNKGGYKILLSYSAGKMVGQCTAFEDTIVIHGINKRIWWGCDSFVIPEFRGKGLGKRMQKKLHDDLPNFSSAWYSPTNGHIKRLCGANELFTFRFYYYPVSSLLNAFIHKIKRKKFRWLIYFPSIPNFYNILNSCNCRNLSVDETKLTEDIVPFINETLEKYDFYVKRDWKYLKWRYLDNPNLKYKVYSIYKKQKIVAIQICSDLIEDEGFRFLYSMDTFILDDKTVRYNQIVSLVSSYLLKKKIKIDGIMSIQETKWLGRFSFSKKGISFLSSLSCEPINNPYLSYSDQDMVQMY